MSYCGRGDLILERRSGIGKEKKKKKTYKYFAKLLPSPMTVPKLTPCSLADSEVGFGLINLILAPTPTRLKALYVSSLSNVCKIVRSNTQ